MPETTPQQPDPALPWLAPLWRRLGAARLADRLPHALLIAGPRGVGKRQLADRLLGALLCQTLSRQSAPAGDPDATACGHCADCLLYAAGSHPDLLRIAPDPESKSGEIAIEPIRDLAERASLTPMRARRKLVLIDPADRMNAAAANALLKTLEEPAGAALLCLIAEQPGRLPATIRSRCQWLRVPVPRESESLAWLAERTGADAARMRLRLAYGAPLRALQDLDASALGQRAALLKSLAGIARGDLDPVTEATAWNGVGARLSLECLAGWLCDLLRLRVAPVPPRLDDPAAQAALGELAGRVDAAAAHRFLRRVLEARGLTDGTINPLLLLESLLIEWSLASQPHKVRATDQAGARSAVARPTPGRERPSA